MLFKKLKSDEFETLNKRITELITDIAETKSLLKSLELENKDLRDKVLRKIQTKKEDIETVKVEHVLRPGEAYMFP